MKDKPKYKQFRGERMEIAKALKMEIIMSICKYVRDLDALPNGRSHKENMACLFEEVIRVGMAGAERYDPVSAASLFGQLVERSLKNAAEFRS